MLTYWSSSKPETRNQSQSAADVLSHYIQAGAYVFEANLRQPLTVHSLTSRESDSGSTFDLTFKMEPVLERKFTTHMRDTIPPELGGTIESWALQNREALSDLLKEDPFGEGMVEILMGSCKSVQKRSVKLAPLLLTKESEKEYIGFSLTVKKED